MLLGISLGIKRSYAEFSPASLPNPALWLDSTYGVATNAAANFTPNSGLINGSPSGLSTGSSERSISAWVYKYANGLAIAVRWGNMSFGDGFYLFDSGTAIGASLYGAAINDPTAYLLNTWYHYVVTYASNGTTNLYRNGALVNTGGMGIANTTNSLLRIGIEANNSAGWNGRISMAGIWNRVLSAGEVTQLYNSGSGLYASELPAGLLSGCVSYYDLKELTNTTRVDSVGGNNLSVLGAVPAAGGLKNVNVADGDPVAMWTARTGQQFIQNTFSQRPIWRSGGGKPYLQFDGVDDVLNGDTNITNLNAGFVIAGGFTNGVDASQPYQLGNFSVNTGASIVWFAGNFYFRINGGTSVNDISTTRTSPANWRLIHRSTPALKYAYVNGVESGNAASSNPANTTKLSLGAGDSAGTIYPYPGEIYSTIIYSSDLTRSQITQLDEFLNTSMP